MGFVRSGFFPYSVRGATGLFAVLLLLCLSKTRSYAQTSIGLDFVGGNSSTNVSNMGTGESAGVVAQTRWNNLTGISGTTSSIVDSGNNASGLTVNYSSLNTWADAAINDTAGNGRMMRGYLDFNVNNGATSVGVSGLNSLMYDVYVYTNGDENVRTGQYSIGSQSFWVKDQATFNGTFIQSTGNVDPGNSASAVAGNYMVFSGLTNSSFTLNAAGAYADDGTLRAPVNAVQIVYAQNILYWDRNGTTAGAGTTPSGTWSTNGNWTTNSAGTSATTNWSDNAVAVFSAGTNATGTYTVDLLGTTPRVNSVLVQEGNVTFSNSSATAATIKFSDATPDFRVETGSTATVNVGITNSTIIASMNGLQKLGGGTLTLGGSATSNAYVGKTLITEGTLRLGTSGVIPNASAVTIASGATLDVNGFAETIGSLAGAGAVTFGGGTLIAGGDNSSTFFSGTLSGGGIFQKAGTGTFSLGADLSYNGEFRLGGGTLALNGFDFTTTIFHVTGNSILDFGASLASILSTTTFLIDSGVTLTVNNWVNTTDFFYSTNNPGGSMGTAPLNQIVFAGFTGNATHWQSFDHQITPVPEPATYGALLIGGLVGFVRLRRRQRN